MRRVHLFKALKVTVNVISFLDFACWTPFFLVGWVLQFFVVPPVPRRSGPGLATSSLVQKN